MERRSERQWLIVQPRLDITRDKIPSRISSPLCNTLTPESASELKILGLDRHTLGMNRGKVGVLKERDEVGLSGFLERHDGRRLEAEIRLVV